jgi:4'-phosphopantetheinyl transferase
VWRAELAVSSATLDRLNEMLAPVERARASRFRLRRHRRQFIVRRGILRALLARYLAQDPAELEFSYDSGGRPMLHSNAATLRFSVSHSDELALYAVSEGRETGVDVERLRSGIATESLAERFFSAREAVALRAIPECRRVEAFLTYWTGKEAYVKARGRGLAIPLDSFDVSPILEEKTALVSVHQILPDASAWSLRRLHPAPGYLGAVAGEGRDWDVRES